MSDIESTPSFTETCSAGHQLFDRVSFCPFCGATVVQAKADDKEVSVISAGTNDAVVTAVEEIPSTVEKKVEPEEAEAEAEEEEEAIISADNSIAPEPDEDEIENDVQDEGKQLVAPSQANAQVTDIAVGAINPSKHKKSSVWGVFIIILVACFLLFKQMGDTALQTSDVDLPEPAPQYKPAPAPTPQYKPAPAPAPQYKPAPAPTPQYKPAPAPQYKPEPEPEPKCRVSTITANTKNQISKGESAWKKASRYINRELASQPVCHSNRSLLLLQDITLTLSTYTQNHNPKGAMDSFNTLIDKYGNKADLIKWQDHFRRAREEQNDCATSGGVWNPNNFTCKY